MDNFRTLKYIGYCMANLPPEEVTNTFEDFLQYCKFQLCLASNRLMKDSIWEDYDSEEIISEYYAHVMVKDPKFAEKFLQELHGLDADIHNWLDQMIDDNQKEMETLAEDTEDSVEFSPETM